VSVSLVAGSALVVLLAIGSYFFVLPMVQSDGPEPKVALQALDTLRHMPSRDEGVTIDASLSKMLDQTKKAGNLISYEGWVIKPVKGDHSKVSLVYSYQEKSGESKRAEWLADLSHNTFMPQNELAVSVSK